MKLWKALWREDVGGLLVVVVVVYVGMVAVGTVKPRRPIKPKPQVQVQEYDIIATDRKTGIKYNLSKGEKPEWMEE